MISLRFIFVIAAIGLFSNVYAKITLPHLVGDNMVLQRDVKVPVWGWAGKGEKVKIEFNRKSYTTIAGSDGKWRVWLDPLPAGGPYDMIITGTNQVVVKNILMGEVWVCSGQSNMEWPVRLVKNAADEMMAAKYPEIRLYTVPHKVSATPEPDTEKGEWVECNPESVSEFSAVGYFFGKNLYHELKVPIGLIHTSWGGTVSETWTSREAISTVPYFEKELEALKHLDLNAIEKNREIEQKDWHMKLKNDMGTIEEWQRTDLNDGSWEIMKLPGTWEAAGLKMDGVVWFRKEIKLSEKEAAGGITLNLACIDDSDESYINGVKIGETANKWDKLREYKIAPANLKPGRNVIAVRVTDTGGGGGIWGKDATLGYVSTAGTTPLAGEWKYKVGANPGPAPGYDNIANDYPSLLFNGMISPIIPFAIKGVIWYQGESNASRAGQYEVIFPLLINDWRNQWGNSTMPFLFVQLANYMQPKPEPSSSEWAELRDAQLKTLSLPNTGMAVTIDIGEADDIHPRNKQDVGYRLFLAATKTAYGQDIVFSGPLYNSFATDGDKIVLSFTNTGSGLMATDKYGYLKGFAVAGEDQKFVWASAKIQGDKVIVWNESVKKPVAVRYAWADNPDDANLCNKEGLPASPFRTDNWSSR